ncbi:unnamed protein product [Pleuronectes platessa]|uniref:Uncharacterized protein n=1 Tax=Pleuronectes platessa TaxID=8262 RepID=A0A9N7UIB9_PLEPL|nr:unnamed protein product [Pleuronectes platessa]
MSLRFGSKWLKSNRYEDRRLCQVFGANEPVCSLKASLHITGDPGGVWRGGGRTTTRAPPRKRRSEGAAEEEQSSSCW